MLRLVIFYLIPFVFWFQLVQSQNTATIPTTRVINQDYGKCNCDLTLNHCDLNCCCDTSCSAADLELFKCPSKNSNSTTQWCVPNNAIFLQNTPYIISSFGDLVCVDVNNTVSLNYYQAPLTDNIVPSDSFVTNIINSVAPQISQYNINFPSSSLVPFTKTDYVWTIFPTNNLNILSIPNQVGSNCRTGPPVYHFQDKISKCLIKVQDVKEECAKTKSTTLSLKYFFNSLKLIKEPNSLKKCLNNTLNPPNPFDYYTTCKDEYFTTVNLRSCSLEDGTVIGVDDCKSNYLEPVTTNNICNRLVKSVTYKLRYSPGNGIIEAGMDIVFFNNQNVGTITSQIEQTFKIYFIPESISLNDFDSVYNQKLSGNPGYLRGLPIQAGSSVIQTDRFKRFTHLVSDSQGLCPKNDIHRDFIKFGQNVVSECIYKPTFDPNLDSYCTLVQNEIDSIVLGYALDRRATRFAPFGNSDTKDWITIKNSDPSSLPQVSNVNGICKSLRIGATIQIAFANVGSVANPQAQIQYISYNWNELTDINLKCSAQYCVNANNIKLKVTTRVIFVDVSQPPLYTESQISKPKTRLPEDFFFPISNSANKISSMLFFSFFILAVFA